MKIYKTTVTDPYFNLASEQYLLDNEPDDVFMLWRNERSVIIGRNQNAYAEINRKYVTDNGIAVVRRLTGGGAVFHDAGNINYSFIMKKGGARTLDFASFCAPVINALNSLGVPAELSGRNDLTVNGRKFSGSAQCVYNGRVLHHGTILFSADMSKMTNSLNADPEKMKSNGVKSVRARVCNLNEYLPDIDVLQLKDYLEKSVDGDVTEFSPEQIKGIEKLKREKYGTWEWNYGKSKTYEKTVKRRFPFGSVEVSYTSEHGVITDIKISGDYFGAAPTSALESSLTGTKLLRGDIVKALNGIESYIHGADSKQIAELFEI